ncbi:MAG: hypothetical protein N3I35_03240 [Clostridia bacterium]|nr:hypothetical protein [Clostridia bacterium]
MKGENRSILKVASIYVATIIGAGFASGQEIVQFFSSYYEGGFYGIMVAGILFALIGYVVLDKVYTERIRNYEELLFPSVGWFLGWVIEIAVSLFMLSVFCIMMAGVSSVLVEKLGIQFRSGVILASVICVIIILSDIKGIVTLSTVLTPVLILGILFVGLFIILYKDNPVFNIHSAFSSVTKNWFFSALIYVGYNSIISIVVMCGMLPQLKTRKTGKAGGIVGGLSLCFIAFLINAAIYIFNPDSISKELPVLSITEKYGNALNGFYSAILLLAMFVSAVTSGYGFIDRLSGKVNINKKFLVVVVCILAIPLSGFGFSNLISTVYPLFGYIGLFVVIVILAQNLRLRPIHLFKKRNK